MRVHSSLIIGHIRRSLMKGPCQTSLSEPTTEHWKHAEQLTLVTAPQDRLMEDTDTKNPHLPVNNFDVALNTTFDLWTLTML